jgi:hypothetical protein
VPFEESAQEVIDRAFDAHRWAGSLVRVCRRIVFVAGASLACTGRQEAPKVPLAGTSPADSAREVEAAHGIIGPAAKTALDSGNALFRKKAYAAALVQYRQASALAPQHAAPLFGIYMVARATNDLAMADTALAGIRQRNGPMIAAPHAFGDSVLLRRHDALRKRAPAG